MINTKKISVLLLYLWLLCIAVFIATVAIGTDKFTKTVLDTDFGKSRFYDVLLVGSVLTGIASFFAVILIRPLYMVWMKMRKNPKTSLLIVSTMFLGLILGYYYLQSSLLLNKFPRGFNSTQYIFQRPQPTITYDEVLTQTNTERQKVGLKPLKSNDLLNQAAELKAKDIFEKQYWAHNSPEGVEPWNWFNKVGYVYMHAGENLGKDFLDTNSLMNSWMNSETHKKNILDPNYYEIGIAILDGRLEGRDTRLVVQHFGTKKIDVKPNYSESDIKGWESNLSKLRAILPSWENTRNAPNLYPNNKDKCERIIEIIKIRITHIDQIVDRMRANQWFTADEQKYANQDQALYKEQETLATFLNSQKW